MAKPEKKHSASCFAEAPLSKHVYRDNALAAIGELGSNRKFVVPLGILGPFSQWLGWPDWLRKGTSLTGCGMLPQRISIADYIKVIANVLERGHGPELIKKTLRTNRFIAGPASSVIITNAPTLGQGLIHLTSLIGATNMKLSLQFVSSGRWTEVNVVQKLPLGAILDFVATIRLILVMRSIEWFLLNDLRPAVLNLTLPHDQSIEHLFRERGVDVEMGATSNRLSFPSDWLKRPNSDYDASFWRLALQHLRKAEEDKG
ncbi:MAG: AraC family transcriptional regulator ligand-binding domain-containing protein, partial [Sphingobium sp.]